MNEQPDGRTAIAARCSTVGMGVCRHGAGRAIAILLIGLVVGATNQWATSANLSPAPSSSIVPVRDSASIRVGVLAHKGAAVCREMWQPTMDYLGEAARPSIRLLPLQFEEVEPAVKNKSIDFLICNPAIYVDLEVRYGVTRIMTLRIGWGHKSCRNLAA